MTPYDGAKTNGGRYLAILALLNECKKESRDELESAQIDEALFAVTIVAARDFSDWKRIKIESERVSMANQDALDNDASEGGGE